MVSAGADTQTWGADPGWASRRRAVAPALSLLSPRLNAADSVFPLLHRFAVAFGEACGMVAGAFGDALGRRLTQSLVVVRSVLHAPQHAGMKETEICQSWLSNIAPVAIR